MRRNIAEFRSHYSSYMDALRTCSDWLQSTAERLDAIRQGDTESDIDLSDRIASLRVLSADIVSFAVVKT